MRKGGRREGVRRRERLGATNYSQNLTYNLTSIYNKYFLYFLPVLINNFKFFSVINEHP